MSEIAHFHIVSLTLKFSLRINKLKRTLKILNKDLENLEKNKVHKWYILR